MSLKKLIIVGAGGFGREILSWLKDVHVPGRPWELAGFLDDNPEALSKYNYKIPILGPIMEYQPQENDLFVMGIASPTQVKLNIAANLMAKGAEFISLIHPTVVYGNNVTFGKGCVICRNTVLTCDIIIGDFVSINIFSVIGHDAIIKEGCTLYSYSNINGFAKLGRGVEIGSHGCVLPGVKVGDFAKVGAGSLAVKSVKSNSTVIGVPAKKL